MFYCNTFTATKFAVRITLYSTSIVRIYVLKTGTIVQCYVMQKPVHYLATTKVAKSIIYSPWNFSRGYSIVIGRYIITHLEMTFLKVAKLSRVLIVLVLRLN